MDFDHLRYFQTLAACGSYTAAAKQLFISQPALSYAISQLEARTEIKLFERTARGVRLTPAGEEYLKHVDRAIEELDIGKARARTIAGGASIVRISLMRVLGAIFLPNAITRFKQAFPDEECKFDLRLGIASEVAADIEEGRSGIGLCSRVGNEELKHIAVAKQKLVVIAPHDHELAQKDSVNLIEAARYPQVGFAPGTGLRQTVDKMYSDAGVSVRYLSEEREDYTVTGMVAASFGIAVVPRLAIFDQLDVRCLEIENENNYRTFYMVYSENAALTSAEKRFIDFARMEVAERGLSNAEMS